MKKTKLEKYVDWHCGMEEKYPGITLLVHMVALLVMNIATKSTFVQIFLVLVTLPTGLYSITFGSNAFKFIPRYDLFSRRWFIIGA